MNKEKLITIQKRIEKIRKDRGETQEVFANLIGVTLNIYKNNVNLSKNPKNIEKTFLPKVAEAFGYSMSYLMCETDNPEETLSGMTTLPINFRQKKDKLADVIQVLNNDTKLLNSLHFLLTELPPKYSDIHKKMILATYESASLYSLFKNPNLFNNQTFQTICSYLDLDNMHEWKKLLLEFEADKLVKSNKRREALRKYIETFFISGTDYLNPKTDTSIPVKDLHINLKFPPANRISIKIKALIDDWPEYKNLKSLQDYEKELVELILDFYKI